MSENNKEKKKEIEVKIDTERTELLARENERLLIEKEQREGKTEDDLASKQTQAIQKFGRADLWLQATSKDMLSWMLTDYINDLAEKSQKNPNPSGSAPLNREQYGQKEPNLYEKKYSSHYEMVNDLISKSHAGNEEAQSYLNSLMKKYILDKKHSPQQIDGFYDPNSIESLAELDLVRKDGFLTPRDSKDGDIGRVLEKFRQERLLRIKKGSE